MRKIEENNLNFCLSIYQQFFVDKDFSFNIRNTLFYGMAVRHILSWSILFCNVSFMQIFSPELSWGKKVFICIKNLLFKVFFTV